MNRATKISGLLLVLLGCAGWIVWFYSSQPATGQSAPSLKPLACVHCGEVYADTVGDLPVKCRHCGEVQAWWALKCQKPDCGAVFPAVRDATGAALHCPKCGGTRTGEVPANEIQMP